MSGSLPIKKLYLDSRYKRKDSVSNSECKFELQQAIHLPLNCVAYIDDVQIPHTWYNVSSTSNKLYIRSRTTASYPYTLYDHVVTMDPKNYTLALLSTELNSKLLATFSGNQLTCSHNERRGTITLTSATGFAHRVFSDEELVDLPATLADEQAWVGPSIPAQPHTMNDFFIIPTLIYVNITRHHTIIAYKQCSYISNCVHKIILYMNSAHRYLTMYTKLFHINSAHRYLTVYTKLFHI